MINLDSYFSSGSAYSSKGFLMIYTSFIWLLVFINFFLLLKVLLLKRDDLIGKSLVFTTLLWLNIWNYGELILTNVQLFSNLTVVVFADIDNIFLPFGLALSILYFSKYLQNQLLINKYSKRINSISSQIIAFAFYATFLALLLLLGRFLLIPFLSINGKEELNSIIEIITIILAIFVLLLLFLALYQLNIEKKFISSKIDRYRIKLYQYFIISLLMSLIFIIINLVSGLFTVPQLFTDLIAVPVYLGSTTGALALYLAYTMPEWLQKRAGLLVSFG